nr:MAG TPA: hypothetical protein [Bacteriophage sp.]
MNNKLRDSLGVYKIYTDETRTKLSSIEGSLFTNLLI